METSVKHYKFINSRTDNIIYYYSLEAGLSPEEVREKLETVKAKVAVNNGVFLDTVYWEEIKDE